MLLETILREFGGSKMEENKLQDLELHIEVLEERVAPSIPPGLHGYEGHPGNQGGHNPGQVTKP